MLELCKDNQSTQPQSAAVRIDSGRPTRASVGARDERTDGRTSRANARPAARPDAIGRRRTHNARGPCVRRRARGTAPSQKMAARRGAVRRGGGSLTDGRVGTARLLATQQTADSNARRKLPLPPAPGQNAPTHVPTQWESRSHQIRHDATCTTLFHQRRDGSLRKTTTKRKTN